MKQVEVVRMDGLFFCYQMTFLNIDFDQDSKELQ